MKSAQNASTKHLPSVRGFRLRQMLAVKRQLSFLPEPAPSGRPLEVAVFLRLGIECGILNSGPGKGLGQEAEGSWAYWPIRYLPKHPAQRH